MTYANLHEALGQLDAGQIAAFVISNPISSQSTYRKINGERSGEVFRLSSYTATQVFHRKVAVQEVLAFCGETAAGAYKQMNIRLEDGRVMDLMISKKGKVHVTVNVGKNPAAEKKENPHNREKNYIIREGMIVPPLIDMGVLTPEGAIIRAKYDKFRQINRFLELIDDEFRDMKVDRPLRIVDFGCGKAYLTFVLYYFFAEIRKIPVQIMGLDLKEDVIRKCNMAAQKYGYTGLTFQVGNIAQYAPPEDVDVVITLHACDTATDYALYNAVKWNAKKIFSVPCCQHEINNSIRAEELKVLTRYGIVKERFSALMTDAIRANILEYCGYETQLLEFIDLEHTPKNIMIRSSRRNTLPALQEARKKGYLAEVEAAMAQFHVKPTLYTLLIEQ